ncbi:DgyrCDS10669 [Dimorphilus gyrociliatus]|uniref:DgyrCDS10669 n=1 Tax=Dimorphilus gyrociliatus TaxID=2664684 RepID=A0A7I8W237_9ANNE|nr:DgyrCDS10669 [Dimorphilus gyrociliatus]
MTEHCVRSGWLERRKGSKKGSVKSYFVLTSDGSLLERKNSTANNIENFSIKNGDFQAFEKNQILISPEDIKLIFDDERDRDDWMRDMKRIAYPDCGAGMFGATLKDAYLFERERNETVPFIVRKCIKKIKEFGLQSQGLFRKSGKMTMVEKLKESFDRGERDALERGDFTDVHSVCSLLKRYLRDLPEPLIPFNCYEKVMQIMQRTLHENETIAFIKLQNTLYRIPLCNFYILSYLSLFLNEVSVIDGNLMNDENLSLIFDSYFIRPEIDDADLLACTQPNRQKATAYIIKKARKLFPEEKREEDIDKLLDENCSVQDLKDVIRQQRLQLTKMVEEKESALTKVVQLQTKLAELMIN